MRAYYTHGGFEHTDSEWSAQHFWLGKSLTICSCAPDADEVRTSGLLVKWRAPAVFTSSVCVSVGETKSSTKITPARIVMLVCDPLSQDGYKVAGKTMRELGNTSPWAILSIYCFWLFHLVGRLFYHSLTAHSQIWPMNDFITHFKWQKSTYHILTAHSQMWPMNGFKTHFKWQKSTYHNLTAHNQIWRIKMTLNKTHFKLQKSTSTKAT